MGMVGGIASPTAGGPQMAMAFHKNQMGTKGNGMLPANMMGPPGANANNFINRKKISTQ